LKGTSSMNASARCEKSARCEMSERCVMSRYVCVRNQGQEWRGNATAWCAVLDTHQLAEDRTR